MGRGENARGSVPERRASEGQPVGGDREMCGYLATAGAF